MAGAAGGGALLTGRTDAEGAGAGTIDGTDSTTSGVTGYTHTNHYSGDGDSPSWTQDSSTIATRYTGGITTTYTSSSITASRLQIADPQGHVITDINNTTNATLGDVGSMTDYDEYGVTNSGPTLRYGWHGAALRSLN